MVSRAYERPSLIVTTNLPFEQWTEVLGSERLTGALLDRLTHRVHILEANGQSCRLADAKRRLKKVSPPTFDRRRTRVGSSPLALLLLLAGCDYPKLDLKPGNQFPLP
jgi:hypothetical protein